MNVDEKKELSQLAVDKALTEDKSSTPLYSSKILPQIDANINSENLSYQAPARTGTGKTQNKGTKKHNARMLKPGARTRTIAAKFYEEQLPLGVDYLVDKVRHLDPKECRVIIMLHNQDENADGDLWVPSFEKWHIHMIMEGADTGTKSKKKQFFTNNFLKSLGIVFRPKIDDDLWRNRGVETVGNFSGYALYLTHETEDAKQNGLKFEYDLETAWHNGFITPKDSTFLKTCEGFMVSNLTLDEVKEIRDGYTRLNLHKRVTFEDLEGLDNVLFELGKEYGDIEKFIDELPFSVRSHCKMKTLRESYDRGLTRRMEEDLTNNRNLERLCVFIQGKSGVGKTYSALKALSDKRVLTVGGQKTGKFDNLKPATQAIIIDDDILPNALQMSDDYPCRAYRRNSNNPVWCGDYLIVTSNLTFAEWLKQCGFTKDEHFTAMTNRFFVCEVVETFGKNYLYCRQIVKRGDAKKVQSLCEKFGDFQKKYNDCLVSYIPACNETVDVSCVNEDVPNFDKLKTEYQSWNDILLSHIPQEVGVSLLLPDIETWFNNRDNEEFLHTVHYRKNGEQFKEKF